MSKVLTSVGILVLMEQGKLHLRDKVSDYLPEFKDMKVYMLRKSNLLALHCMPFLKCIQCLEHANFLYGGSNSSKFSILNNLHVLMCTLQVVVGNYEPNATLDSTSIEDAKKPILIVDLLRHTSGIYCHSHSLFFSHPNMHSLYHIQHTKCIYPKPLF